LKLPPYVLFIVFLNSFIFVNITLCSTKFKTGSGSFASSIFTDSVCSFVALVSFAFFVVDFFVVVFLVVFLVDVFLVVVFLVESFLGLDSFLDSSSFLGSSFLTSSYELSLTSLTSLT